MRHTSVTMAEVEIHTERIDDIPLSHLSLILQAHSEIGVLLHTVVLNTPATI